MVYLLVFVIGEDFVRYIYVFCFICVIFKFLSNIFVILYIFIYYCFVYNVVNFEVVLSYGLKCYEMLFF